MNDHNPGEPATEQLLKMLDLQLAESRKRRELSEASRGKYRVAAVLFIVLGAALALGALMFVLDGMRPANRQNPSAIESN